MASEPSLFVKPRILGPAIKICFELYHALRPYHENASDVTIGMRAFALFTIAMRWYRFLKTLIHDKIALDLPLTLKEKFALFAGIMGHVLIVMAQRATIKYQQDLDEVFNDKGPYCVVRYPHLIGKWIADSAPGLYQRNRISMAVSVLTFGLMVREANKKEGEKDKAFDCDESYQNYKRVVPHKIIPGIL